MSTRRALRWAALLAACYATVACDATARGRAAFDGGRFLDAFAAFTESIASEGEGSSPELLYDRALAALRAGDAVGASDAAVRAIDVATARGRPDVAALASFVRGNAAWMRCDAADAESLQRDADPTALDRAIAHAETALGAWRDAIVAGSDAPEARRNAERAVLRLASLRRRTPDDPNRKDPGAPPPPPVPTPQEKDPSARPKPPADAPPPPPRPTGQSDDATNDPRYVARTDELPQDQVLRVLDTLAAKEREKAQVRRAQRAVPQPGVEKDW
ncbi:MAG: hypothetical protein K8T90_03025 [Planctomycetes bacterium]|nr:hypothetical protein [Planctomycetota bacterium]